MKKSVADLSAARPLPRLDAEDVKAQLFCYSPDLGQLAEHAVQAVSHLTAKLKKSDILSPAEAAALQRAAVWQDSGLLLLPQNVLLKSAPFTLAEKQLIETHVGISCALAEQAGADADTLQIIAAHHEQVNGGGYPAGLQENEIPLCAQLLRLVNDYCLLQTDLPGRPGVRSCYALQILEQQTGKKYSPKVFEEMFLPALGDFDFDF